MTDAISPSRRRFLKASAALAALASTVPPVAWGGESPATLHRARLQLGARATGRTVPRGLVGLSFETLQMHDPAYFSASNKALVGLLRRLNPAGVLRLGGNSSDYSVWSEYRGPLPPFASLPHAVFRRPYVITPEQLANLRGFLDATGWRLVFGVNVHRGSPAMAAALAEAVERTMGDRLLAIHIGNEPNMYRGTDGHGMHYEDYLAMWRAGAQAVRRRTPVPIAGPDTGANTDWVLQFADQADGIVALSRHYYRGGAPEPTTSIRQLLSGDPEFIGEVRQITRAADAKQLPFWISETNSYWGGGKLGVSNTFASALWGGDYALACAQAGASVLNFHGGTLSVLEASLDKNVPAAPKGASYEQRLDAISGRYTPIAGDVGEGYYARPLYYGLLLARHFEGARFVDVALAADGTNLTAYAAERDGRRLLAVFNKDLRHDAELQIDTGVAAAQATVWRLRAPAIDDVHHSTFAGAAVGHDGAWSPRATETMPMDHGRGVLRLPLGSAALLTIGA